MYAFGSIISGTTHYVKSVFGQVDTNIQQNKDIQENLNQIKNRVDKRDFAALTTGLNQLCEPRGYAEINVYNDNFQVHLFFTLEGKRQAVMSILSEQFKNYDKLGCNNLSLFQNWQLGQKDELFPLKLATNQSVALLGIDPFYTQSFKDGQDILKQTKNHLTLTQLPEEIILKIFSFLPLKDLAGVAKLNKFTCSFLSENNQLLWKKVARNLNYVIDEKSEKSYKRQIKDNSIELPEFIIDLTNCVITMKVEHCFELKSLFKDVFIKYVPDGYYLKHYYGYGSEAFIYRDEDKKVCKLITVGRMGKQCWGRGEEELRKKIIKEMKPFTVHYLKHT